MNEGDTIRFSSIKISGHSYRRMFERNISPSMVREAAEQGVIIKCYPDDTPYPSCLILGYHESVPMHIVASVEPETDVLIVITAYFPDPSIWDDNFSSRRNS